MQFGYPDTWDRQPAVGVRSDTLGKVLALLGMASLFTAGGALAGPLLGRSGFWIGLIGSIACLIVLSFVKDRAPLNLVLLYAFASLEGVVLGQLVESYIASGLGLIVLDAAAATGGVALVAGAYGYTTKRNLSGLGGILFVGLLVVLGASLLGLFLHLPLLGTLIAAVSAVLFTGFLIYDLNRVANTAAVSQGDAILLAVSVYLDILNLFLALLRLLTDLLGQSER